MQSATCRAAMHELGAAAASSSSRADRDRLWFVGDLVNRGPDSLAGAAPRTGARARGAVVLGNHDLHLLAVAHGSGRVAPRRHAREVLAAPDRERCSTGSPRGRCCTEDPKLDGDGACRTVAAMGYRHRAPWRASSRRAAPRAAELFDAHVRAIEPDRWDEPRRARSGCGSSRTASPACATSTPTAAWRCGQAVARRRPQRRS